MGTFNKEFFKYALLDSSNKFIRYMNNVESATITYSSLSRLKQNATINIVLGSEEKLDINNRIQIKHVLNGKETDIGTFLISTPVNNLSKFFKSVSVECYSTLWLIEANKTTKRTVIGIGTNVVNEVRRILKDYGVDIFIEESTKSTSVEREFEIGTPILDLCNSLLESINYTHLYVDQKGNFISKQYVLPFERDIDIEYIESNENSIIEPFITSTLDYFDVPNVFVKYVNNPEAENLVAVYENTNPQSATSTLNRPRNVHSEEVTDVSDVQTLYDMCKKDLQNYTSSYHRISIKTAINPLHGYMNSVYIDINGVKGKFYETDWTMECVTGGTMTHELRESVVI